MAVLSRRPLLEAMPEDGRIVTVDELAALSGMTPHLVHVFAHKLVKERLAWSPKRGRYGRTEAAAAALAGDWATRAGTPRGAPRAHNPDGVNDRVWRALRMLKRATLADLLELVDSPNPTAQLSAHRYLAQLTVAGVTAQSPKLRGLKASYRLLRDLGPKAPIFRQREKRLWDQNSAKFVDEPAP